MPAPTFDRELQRLQDELLTMSAMAERALVASVDTLKRRDLAGAQELIGLERQIGKRRFAIEMNCLTLVTTHCSAWKLDVTGMSARISLKHRTLLDQAAQRTWYNQR